MQRLNEAYKSVLKQKGIRGDLYYEQKITAIKQQIHSPNELFAKYNTTLQTCIYGMFDSTYDLDEEYPSETIFTIERVLSDSNKENLLTEFIKGHLIEVCNFVNVERIVTDKQLDTLAKQIQNCSPHLKIMEFIFFCSKLRSGDYGSFYGKIDPQQIMIALNKFKKEIWSDRNKALVEKYANKK